MSKIRNSLGVLVLPIPVTAMTFEEYKKEYGIDLDTIVEVGDGARTVFKPSFSKLIALALPPSILKEGAVIPSINFSTYIKDEDSLLDLNLIAPYLSYSGGTVSITSVTGIVINGQQRKVGLYEI